MSKNNDVVIIELDRPRELRFGHKAIKTLQAITGKGIEEIGDNMSIEDMEKFLYCGLLSDARNNQEILKLEQMEDLLDEAKSFGYIIEKLQEATEKAFGTSEGNGQKATAKK